MRKIKRGIDYGSVDVLISLLRNIDKVNGHDVVISKAKEQVFNERTCESYDARIVDFSECDQTMFQLGQVSRRYQPMNRIKTVTRSKMAKAA